MSEKKANVPSGTGRGGNRPLARQLREAVVWREVLDKPVSRRRKRG